MVIRRVDIRMYALVLVDIYLARINSQIFCELAHYEQGKLVRKIQGMRAHV